MKKKYYHDCKMNMLYFANIYNCKKQVETIERTRFRISRRLVFLMETFVESVFERIMYEAGTVCSNPKTKTLHAETIAKASYICFVGQIGRDLQRAALMKQNTTIFPANRLHRRMKAHILAPSRVHVDAALALARVLESITILVLRLCVEQMAVDKYKTLLPIHMARMLQKSPSLKSFFAEINWSPAKYRMPALETDFALLSNASTT